MAERLKKPYSQASSSEAAPPSPPWVELPWDITANILQRLGAEEMLESAQKVCTTWRNVCKQPSLWRKIHLSPHSNRPLKLEVMCRHAVDRSQGQLQDISICGFGSISLLNYIARRSSELRCLSLEFNCSISKKGLVKAAKGFPLLEELRLSNILFANTDVVQRFFRCCPFLKSVTLCHIATVRGSWLFDFYSNSPDGAKAMSQLRHLCIVGSSISNQNLVAILDGCTRLESLHLEGCGPRIHDDLVKRLSQQIKHLKLSLTNYNFRFELCSVPR